LDKERRGWVFGKRSGGLSKNCHRGEKGKKEVGGWSNTSGEVRMGVKKERGYVGGGRRYQ